nr:immunoglobulin heavy chain junction region [Macaca mulatta]
CATDPYGNIYVSGLLSW